MKTTTILKKQDELQDFCKNNGIVYLGLFGSYARGDNNPSSDVDLLFELNKQKAYSLFDIGKMQYELEKILNRHVDFVERNNIKPEFKPYIFSDLISIYEER